MTYSHLLTVCWGSILSSNVVIKSKQTANVNLLVICKMFHMLTGFHIGPITDLNFSNCIHSEGATFYCHCYVQGNTVRVGSAL